MSDNVGEILKSTTEKFSEIDSDPNLTDDEKFGAKNELIKEMLKAIGFSEYDSIGVGMKRAKEKSIIDRAEEKQEKALEKVLDSPEEDVTVEELSEFLHVAWEDSTYPPGIPLDYAETCLKKVISRVSASRPHLTEEDIVELAEQIKARKWLTEGKIAITSIPETGGKSLEKADKKAEDLQKLNRFLEHRENIVEAEKEPDLGEGLNESIKKTLDVGEAGGLHFRDKLTDQEKQKLIDTLRKIKQDLESDD